METIKTRAIQTDKNKKYCKYCGTFTVYKKGCVNINHECYSKNKDLQGVTSKGSSKKS